MTIGTDYLVAEKRKSAAALLVTAANYFDAQSPGALFKKNMKLQGGGSVLIRIDAPGILRVFDLTTSELLAESEPGQFRKLR